jgi:hypothetical protein
MRGGVDDEIWFQARVRSPHSAFLPVEVTPIYAPAHLSFIL